LKKPPSDIPLNVIERAVEGSVGFTECILDGCVVGRRIYYENGKLLRETPLRDGRKHGKEFEWDEDGTLLSVEPYFEGQIHGLAKQYGRDGKVIGTYRFVHGTGYDIWRWEWWKGFAPVSEIHSMRDGVPHGYEWWLEPDQRNVHHERHWYHGNYHGIERRWNYRRNLRRGYPKYWIQGEAVTKRQYMRAGKFDKSLPPFQPQDNLPRRRFPPLIQRVLLRPTAAQLRKLER
jgi:MORN repeat variant